MGVVAQDLHSKFTIQYQDEPTGVDFIFGPSGDKAYQKNSYKDIRGETKAHSTSQVRSAHKPFLEIHVS